MGIKGIYKEIGPGDRISLCKLAVKTLEETGRPLRLAIDFSIWQFQVQAARGGSNPAIRTLFYRLVRLLGLAIQPVFVFDGPNKPAFKRNKRSSGRGDAVATAMAKRLISLFGFLTHDAPGEAEAECALLEQQGVVDAVLSEDVDTIMFGCRKTLRNWSAEGPRASKTPTHVSMYDATAIAGGPSKLDREGMVLVALMSGGDYLPEGVPGCGVKVACEVARAGFGRDLCRIKRADRDGLAAWKERLLHELRTNESGLFRTRHKALEIPECFPNMEVLRYYTHPVVSREATVARLKDELTTARAVDVVGLREFTRETFDWAFRIGAVKLTRVLAPSLLVQEFLKRSDASQGCHEDPGIQQQEESALAKAISSKRAHFSTDATPELRVSFVPANIVGLDLDKEPEEEVEAFGRDGIALNSDDEFDEEAAELDGQSKAGNVKKPFDPLQPDLVWVPETVARLGIPRTVEKWEAKQQVKEQQAAAKATRKTRTKKTDMPVGALDKYVKVTKRAADSTVKDSVVGLGSTPSPPKVSSHSEPVAPRGRSKQSKNPAKAPQATQPSADVNPWTLAGSQASPKATKSFPYPASQVQVRQGSASDPIIFSSSPVAAASPQPLGETTKDSQRTPTRATAKQRPLLENASSPPPLFGLSPSPRKYLFRAPEDSMEQAPSGTETQLSRKARPFKRVKSGAEDKPRTAMQKSIKDFSRISKGPSSSQEQTKVSISSTGPIEIPSDDEAFPLSPPMRPPVNESDSLKRNTTPPPAGNFNITSDDDDPFASPLSAIHPPRSSCAPPKAGRSEDDTDHLARLGEDCSAPASNASSTSIGSDLPPTVTKQAESATAKAKGTTTKVYIPRTSLNGLGYFDEVEVSREEAERMTAALSDDGDDGLELPGIKRGKGPRRRAYRLSEVEVLDLTGED
ncbi:uncharacterized protein B0T15DRAFT_436098 [Chaetomium strumarium]|uniref:Flap structure-specific endonuclease n=1 Tax=Chaetomium strumarium TaxID=1170767 RepID=A0AAJ0GPV8_9PEZI|nr:hypothetical protein B0T15DRAFT_436098 [Chaetomium strumarium]